MNTLGWWLAGWFAACVILKCLVGGDDAKSYAAAFVLPSIMVVGFAGGILRAMFPFRRMGVYKAVELHGDDERGPWVNAWLYQLAGIRRYGIYVARIDGGRRILNGRYAFKVVGRGDGPSCRVVGARFGHRYLVGVKLLPRHVEG